MAVTTKTSNQELDARNWYFGGRHIRKITFVDDASGSLRTESVDLNTIDENYEEKKFVVWFNDGGALAPTVDADQILIEVSYTTDDAAATIAGLFKTAVELVADVFVDVAGDAATVENKFLGKISVEQITPALTTELCDLGFGGNIGAIATGGASLTTEQSLEDILSDQTGDIIIDQIMKGSSVSLDMTLAEMTVENWQNLVGEGFGDKLEVMGKTLTGYGTSKLYNSSFDFAGMLVGHKINAAASDRDRDVCIWKCVGNLNSINYSGSEVQGGEFSFQALKDNSKDSKIDLFMFGDHSLV